MTARALVALAGLAALAPRPAAAHLVGVEFGDFYAGALHVLTGVEYVAGLVGLSILAALQPRAAGRWVLVAAPPAMALGALVGALGAVSPAADPLAFGAVAGVGALAAAGVRLPAWGVGAVAACVGLVHGYANGLAALEGELHPALYAAGVAAAGGVGVTLGAALATAAAARARIVAIAWRVAGSWIAAIGAAALALSLVRAAAA